MKELTKAAPAYGETGVPLWDLWLQNGHHWPLGGGTGQGQIPEGNGHQANGPEWLFWRQRVQWKAFKHGSNLIMFAMKSWMSYGPSVEMVEKKVEGFVEKAAKAEFWEMRGRGHSREEWRAFGPAAPADE